MYRVMLLAIWILPCLAADSPEDNRPVMRKAIELMRKDDESMNRLLFVRRREVKEFEADGKLKKKHAVTTKREPYEGMVITRLIARDDKPLDEAEHREQDEKIKANVAAFRGRMAEQKGKLQEKPATTRRDSDQDAMMREFPEALNYKKVGEETLRGRATDVYEFRPRPGYQYKSFKHKFFEKVRGKAWIDRETGQLARVDAEMFDTVNVGFGVLGRMQKGTRFRMTRIEASPGIWVQESTFVKFAARFLLVKNLFQETDVRYSEFQLRPAKPQAASTSN